MMKKKKKPHYFFPQEKKTHPILKNCPDVCNILEMDFMFVMETR